jgi:hypothetical protein
MKIISTLEKLNISIKIHHREKVDESGWVEPGAPFLLLTLS